MDSQHRQSQIALNGRVSDCSSRTGTVSEVGTVKYQVPVAQSGIGSCVSRSYPSMFSKQQYLPKSMLSPWFLYYMESFFINTILKKTINALKQF